MANIASLPSFLPGPGARVIRPPEKSFFSKKVIDVCLDDHTKSKASSEKILFKCTALMSRLSTKNYKPRATGSLRHLMLKVLARHTITALYRLNYST